MNDFEKIIDNSYDKPPKLTLRQRMRFNYNENRARQDPVEKWLTRIAVCAAVAATAATCARALTHSDKPLTYKEKLTQQYNNFADCVRPLDSDIVQLKLVFPEYRADQHAEDVFARCRKENPMPMPSK